MTKSDLKSMTVAELKALARKKKVTLASNVKKAEIIDALAGAFKPVKTALRSAAAAVKKTKQKKAAKKKTAASSGTALKAGTKKTPLPRKTTRRPASMKAGDTAGIAKAAAIPRKNRPAAGTVKTASTAAAAAGSIRAKATPVHEWKLPATDEEPLIAHERVTNSKFYTGPDKYASFDAAGDLPRTYGQDRIVLMTRDPFVMYAYWETTPKRLEKEKAWFGWDSVLSIRIYDITGVQFDGRNALGFFDQEVREQAGNWYFDLGRPSHSFCADIGLLSPTGRFLTLSRSNYVTMPREGVSDVIDEEWSLVDDAFWKLYGFEAFRSGASSPEMRDMLKRRREREITSPGAFAPGRAKAKRK